MYVCSASSASASAASHTATATGPIGFSITATGTAASASASATGTHQSNGARGGKLKGIQNAKHVFKVALALAAALAGMVIV